MIHSSLHSEALPEKYDLNSLGVYIEGEWEGYRELVDFGKRVGLFSREVTHQLVPTTRGIIHYNKSGEAHIIPARPNGNLPEFIEDAQIRRKVEILVCLQRVLVGAIFPKLRAAQVNWDDKGIILYFIFDGKITEYEREEMECVASEVVASFPDGYLLGRFFQVDYPRPVPLFGEMQVFARKEANSLEKSSIYFRLWQRLKNGLRIYYRIANATSR